MTNQNDLKILELQKKIEKKKKELSTQTTFVSKTNCSIEIDGERMNIRVLSKEQLIGLVVKLNAYYLSSKELGLDEEYEISGYHIFDWISDIMNRLEVVKRNEKEKALVDLENSLLEMLTDHKRVEMEITNIERLLD